MAISSFIGKSFQNSSNINSATSTITDTGLIQIADVCTAGGTNTVTLAYDASTVVAVYIQCTNDGTTFDPDGSSPTLTFSDASCSYTWQTADQYANVWNDDITSILVTNGSMSVDDNFVIWVAYTV